MFIMDIHRVQGKVLQACFTSFVSSTKDSERSKKADKVWYLSYGSNMCMERFMRYVEGGTYNGLSRVFYGCRDKTPPSKSEGVVFNGSMYYAGESRQWGGGGYSFVDFSTPSLVLGRAYLVTVEQFEDIVSQECGGEAGSMSVNLDELLDEGEVFDDGEYGHMVYVCDYDGYPVVSFTTGYSLGQVASGVASMKLNKPSVNYCDVLRVGLMETFKLDEADADEYINNRV